MLQDVSDPSQTSSRPQKTGLALQRKRVEDW
jgi:hypothetical protein